MKHFLLSAFLFLFTLNSALSQNNVVPEDSTAFVDFLILQEEVPGLGYRFSVTGNEFSKELNQLGDLGFTLNSEGGYTSKILLNWAQFFDLENQIVQFQVRPKLEFLVFSSPNPITACREYLLEVIQTGDYNPIFEKKKTTEDLISLASQEPYTPFQKFRLFFVSDYKLFLVSGIIILFFTVSSGLTLFMLILKIKKGKRDKLIEKYDQDILLPLSSLPFEKEVEEIQAMSIDELHEYFPKDLLEIELYQEVLIDRIISLNKKMKGDFKLKFKTLYLLLGLDKVSIRLLKEKSWDRKTLALVQINEMDLVEALPLIRPLVNHDNFYVRSQAVATLLNISQSKDLAFLRDLTYPLSNWQQMNYLRIIKFISSQGVVNIEVLFESENETVRLFAIKLVRQLGRLDLMDSLSSLTKNATDQEKVELLKTYAAFGAHMELSFVHECLNSFSSEVFQEAISAAAILGDDSTILRLSRILNSRQLSFGQLKLILFAMREIDFESFDQAIQNTDSIDIQNIGKHLKDPLLKNV